MSGAPSEGPAAAAQPLLSIVLATFNERRNLPQVVDRIRQQRLPPFEIIVVDDGSTDGTREFLDEAARSDPWIRPVYHEGKQTTVRAQCQGIGVATGRLVVIMDADLQHPPELLPSMVQQLQGGSALVLASRYAPGGSPGPRTLARWFYSHGAALAAAIYLPEARRVKDPVSGYFGFRREIWIPLDPEIRGYKLSLFLLVMANGRPVTEVPFRFEPRTEGASKVTESSAFIGMYLREVRLARRLRNELHGSGRSPAG